MNSSPNRASNPAGRPRRKDVSLDYVTASQMLPLVRGIATDIVAAHHKLAELAPEQESLDRNRRALTWDKRQRRYTIGDEIATTEKVLAGAVSELDALGLRLSDDGCGAVDFPTRINGRPAAFSWQVGEDRLGYWRYTGEDLRRPIPTDWQPAGVGKFRQEP